MVKFLACLFMVIDHIGCYFFPQLIWLRMIGRISMPFFAYAIARGFFYSKKKNTLSKYLKNLLIFSLISQIPYFLLHPEGTLNIGFTWLFSLIILIELESKEPILKRILTIAIACCLSIFFPVSYGLYGVLFPILFYCTLIKKKEPLTSFYLSFFLWIVFFLLTNGENIYQIFATLSIPLLLLAIKYDRKIKLPKSFFYLFYPAHLMLIYLLKLLLSL